MNAEEKLKLLEKLFDDWYHKGKISSSAAMFAVGLIADHIADDMWCIPYAKIWLEENRSDTE